jgi:bacterioferritin-associated ferredoxin
MFVCCCMGVTDRAIRQAIEDGASTVEEITSCTGAGSRCGSCRRDIHAMIAACPAPSGRRLPYLADGPSAEPEPGPPPSVLPAA